MNEKFTIDDFTNPLENLEHVLEMLEGFYSDERFEDMDDALELIESYKRAVSILKEVEEEEQRYYILDSYDIPLLERVDNQIQRTATELSIYEKGRDNSRFKLTEQEIEGYDKRYWSFAEPVDQADFRLLF